MKSKPKRLLIVTDNRYVSAVLCHGLGLPPWRDLPAAQADPGLRQAMTASVNRAIQQARRAGFNAFDVHEAFPVDFMRMDPAAEIIRNADYFLLERHYHSVRFLRCGFKRLQRGTHLAMIKSLRLGRAALTETALLALYFRSHGIRPLNMARTASPARLPAEFTISFDPRVTLKNAAVYPGVIRSAPHVFTARIARTDQLLEFYRYAGLQIINANIQPAVEGMQGAKGQRITGAKSGA